MSAATQVSVQEYLGTVYEPDCDYVDGLIVERNAGERTHSEAMGHVLYYFLARRKAFGLHPYPIVRIQVGPTRFRVPDISLYGGKPPQEQVFTRPPLAVIEILSPHDLMSATLERIGDYLRFGVSHVFLVDPHTRRAWLHAADGAREVKSLDIRNGDTLVKVPLAGIFASIDEE